MIPVAGQGEFHEEDQIYRSADCIHFEAGGGRNGCRRGLSEGRNFGRHLLQLAQKVCRFDAVQDEAIAPARGGKRQAEADRGGPVTRQGHVAGCPLKKNFKACPQTPIGGWRSVRLEGIDQARLFGLAD